MAEAFGEDFCGDWTEEEQAAILDLMEKMDLSFMGVLRQSVRLYQLHTKRIADGETVSWSGDEDRMMDFSGYSNNSPEMTYLETVRTAFDQAAAIARNVDGQKDAGTIISKAILESDEYLSTVNALAKVRKIEAMIPEMRRGRVSDAEFMKLMIELGIMTEGSLI